MDPPGTVDDVNGGGGSPGGYGGSPVPDALDPDDVRKVASEEGYELVYYSRESRLISFERDEGECDDALAGSDHGGSGEKSDDDVRRTVRVDVYWATGTVGTRALQQGETQQLFRRGASLRALSEIFKDPTGAHYEVQDGGDPEPHDGTPDHHDPIDLLQETNVMLREQMSKLQVVEVSGPRGCPVYARGSFRDGRWMMKRGGFWGVDLAMASDDASEDDDIVAPIPISAVNDLEIRLGGVIYATATSHEVFAQMDEQEWDGDDRKEVLCHFGGPVTGIWIPLRIDGWPKDHWSLVQRKESSRKRNEYRDNLDVYEVLLDDVCNIYPEATISFHRLSFFGECVEQMVDNLGLAIQSEEESQAEEELWNIANLVVSELRSAGNDDVGEAFMKRVNDLQLAAYYVVQMATLSNEEVEEEIPKLVRMQLASQSTADFLFQVQRTYGISNPDGD